MSPRPRILLVSLLVSGLALAELTACGERLPGEQGGGGEDTLTVFAASSLTDAFEELANDFEEENPGTDVRMNFGSSTTLLTQIQHGAPADVFASAAEEEMRTAVDDDLVAGEPEVFVRNREIIMVPKDNPADVRSMRDLARPGVKLVLAEEGVPAADYAVQILRRANAQYGKNFKQDVLSNVVSREADVRAAVSRVGLGDADATLVYASDYTPDIKDRVRSVPISEELNIVATYPIATLKDAQNPGLARRWVDLVLSDKGQRVLEKWNFEPVAG